MPIGAGERSVKTALPKVRTTQTAREHVCRGPGVLPMHTDRGDDGQTARNGYDTQQGQLEGRVLIIKNTFYLGITRACSLSFPALATFMGEIRC